MKVLIGFSIGLVALAVGSVVGIAILVGFKNAGLWSGHINATGDGSNVSVENNTIDLFIAGIAVFGTFATVLALVIIGKVVMNLIRPGKV